MPKDNPWKNNEKHSGVWWIMRVDVNGVMTVTTALDVKRHSEFFISIARRLQISQFNRPRACVPTKVEKKINTLVVTAVDYSVSCTEIVFIFFWHFECVFILKSKTTEDMPVYIAIVTSCSMMDFCFIVWYYVVHLFIKAKLKLWHSVWR